jgi:phospholipid-binding lipoprotein MlaA
MSIIVKISNNCSRFANSVARCLGGCAVLAVAACGPAPAPEGISDPNEAQNRDFHRFNQALDTAVVRPVAKTYVAVLPPPVVQGVSNFASNLDLPGMVVNDLLQARPGDAAQNTLRFAVNTVFGLGGLFDPASAGGLPAADTDFGATLNAWGLPEGNYIEMPALGPTTDRDLLGSIVDYVMNPVRLLVPAPERYVDTLAALASRIGERGRYSETVDSILYDSADSYAQTRLLYLQSRRYELGQTSNDQNFEDPYAQ